MEMEAVFYPPFEGAGMLDEDEIIKDIQHLGVKNGIKTDVVKDFLAHRRYGHRYVIAVGTAATEGSDGYIEYKFNTELKPTPKMNDDGTVDFHTLENVNHIRRVRLLPCFIRKTAVHREKICLEERSCRKR